MEEYPTVISTASRVCGLNSCQLSACILLFLFLSGRLHKFGVNGRAESNPRPCSFQMTGVTLAESQLMPPVQKMLLFFFLLPHLINQVTQIYSTGSGAANASAND